MNTKKLAILASAIIAATCAHAAKELIEGYTWEYTVSGGKAIITGVDPEKGNLSIPSILGGYPVKAIGEKAFNKTMAQSGRLITGVYIPEGIESIGYGALYCHRAAVNIPSSLRSIDNYSFDTCTVVRWDVAPDISFKDHSFYCGGLREVHFLGRPPENFMAFVGCSYENLTYFCKRQYGSTAARIIGGQGQFGGYIDDMPEVEIVSSAMRKDDPTVMDVVYKVYSSAKTVKVRAMAWENGERNLSKAIRPTKWIEGTEANIGDAVTANEEHKLSWRIAGDWATDLSKVKLEVLAVEDDLLPLELQTIPATATHQKMKISWNKMTADHVFDALLWLYADGDAGLTLTNGQLKNGANLLASGTGLYNTTASVSYVFGKMGYQVLAGDELAYARRVTQLELPVSGVQQFAVKYPDAK